MSIEIQYLGILADKTGKSSESLNTAGSITEILKLTLESYPELGNLSFVVSHNGSIQHGKAEVRDGDIITLIPPAPGG